MKRIFTVTLAAAAVTLAIAGDAVAQEGKPQAEERLASFEMAWPKLKTEAITARARAAAEVMTGQQLSRPAVVVSDQVIRGKQPPHADGCARGTRT